MRLILYAGSLPATAVSRRPPMKVHSFHLMPHPYLPDDFAKYHVTSTSRPTSTTLS